MNIHRYAKFLLPFGLFIGIFAFLVLQAKPVAAQDTLVVDSFTVTCNSFQVEGTTSAPYISVEVINGVPITDPNNPNNVHWDFLAREFVEVVNGFFSYTVSFSETPPIGNPLWLYVIGYSRPFVSWSIAGIGFHERTTTPECVIIDESAENESSGEAVGGELSSEESGGGLSTQPVIRDGRLNLDVGAPVVVFPEPYGFAFYEAVGSQGVLSLVVECSQITAVGAMPEQNTLIAQSVDGRTRLYRLSTGEFQVNFVQYPGAPIYSHIWTASPCSG